MSNSYQMIKKFMRSFPMTIAWRTRRHSKVIDKYLNPEEEILYMFAGQKNDSAIEIFHTYVVAFTNKRIILATKRVLFGHFFKSITPDMYNDLTVHKGLIWGSITLDTVKEVITITNLDVRSLNDIETNVTEIMLKHKKVYGTLKREKSTVK